MSLLTHTVLIYVQQKIVVPWQYQQTALLLVI